MSAACVCPRCTSRLNGDRCDGCGWPADRPAAKLPEYVYAESREEAQRLLDESYLSKFRAVPVRWWSPMPNGAPKSMGFARYCFVLGILVGFAIYRIVEVLT